MKRIALTTAAALMLGTATYADGHAAMTYEVRQGEDFHASTLIGMRVYSTDTEFTTDTVATNAQLEWDDIGEINDLIVSKSGTVEAAIIGVGGFLGLGERDVALTMDAINVLDEEGDTGDRFLVVNYTAEQLEAAPAYERAPTPVDTGVTTPVQSTDLRMNRPLLTAPDVTREGYTLTTADTLTAQELEGTYVYGVNDVTVGEVDSLLLTADGKVDQAVINVGGFLGLGEKPVAVTMDELTLMRAGNGALRVYIDSSQEALEAQPTYEG